MAMRFSPVGCVHYGAELNRTTIPTAPVVGNAAVANAVFPATGKRIRDLPIRAEKLP
jgi:hypothetical protein